jgi:cysteinyl-tRNA synthetase
MVAGLMHVDDRRAGMDTRVEQLLFDLKKGLGEALEDDLSLYRFWPVLFDFCRTVNKMLDRDRLGRAEADQILERLEAIDEILGIVDWGQLPLGPQNWPPDVAGKVRAREEAKKLKDFSKADQLRSDLNALGYRVEDTPKGTRLYKGGGLEIEG